MHAFELAALVPGAALFGLAILLAHRRRWTQAALAVTLAGGLLRLYSAGDLYLHEWDERYHAVVARNLLEHPFKPMLYADPVLPYDYRQWISNHVWLHKPPLTLWLMSLGLALFGVSEIALRLPSVLLSTLSILWTWGTGRRLFDERVALLAAGFQAVNSHLLELVGGQVPTDHVDAVFGSLVSLGVWLAVVHRGHRDHRESGGWLPLLGVGVATGLALLTKWLVALIIPAVWGALWLVPAWQRWRRDGVRGIAPLAGRLLVILLAAAALALPWTIYTRLEFPSEANWEASYNTRHIYESLEEHSAPPYYYLWLLPWSFGAMAYLPLAWFLARAAWRRDPRQDLPLAVWFLVPLVLFSLMATKMPSYLMLAAPAVFLMESAFCWWLYDRMTGNDETAGAADRAMPVRLLAGLLLALVVLAPVSLFLERLEAVMRSDRNPAWARQLRSLGAEVQEMGDGKAVLFNVERPVEAMFYVPHPVYDVRPTAEQVRDLRGRGYRVLVRDRGRMVEISSR